MIRRHALVLTLAAAVLPSALLWADGGAAVQVRRSDGLQLAAAFEAGLASDTLVLTRAGARTAAFGEDSNLPRRWTAAHASLSISPFGPGFASSGLNGAGLAIHLVWREGTDRLEPAPLLATLQWVQHCLDRFERVSDVVHSASASDVAGLVAAQILACDATGVCGIVEHDGEQVVDRVAERLPLPLLTGASYAESLDFLNRTLGYGGAPRDPDGDAAAARFARAAQGVNRARSAQDAQTVDDLLAVLALAAPDDRLPLRVVYDQLTRRVELSRPGWPSRRTVEIDSLGGLCGPSLPPVALLELVADGVTESVPPAAGGLAVRGARQSPWLAATAPELWLEVDAVIGAIECRNGEF